MTRCFYKRENGETVCFLCNWYYNYINLIYDKVLTNEQEREGIKDFDMKCVLPLLRNTLVEWFEHNMEKVFVRADKIKNISEEYNENPFIMTLKNVVCIYEKMQTPPPPPPHEEKNKDSKVRVTSDPTKSTSATTTTTTAATTTATPSPLTENDKPEKSVVELVLDCIKKNNGFLSLEILKTDIFKFIHESL